MAENENPTRPVRTLTVKNFSVIKEAKLEFGKITVLIGPQASGKSLLCKLAFFFQQVVTEQAEESIKVSEDFEQLRPRITDAFLSWFSLSSASVQSSEICYHANLYRVSLLLERGTLLSERKIQWKFSREFEDCYKSVWNKLNSEKQRRESLPNPKFFAEDIRDQLAGLRSPDSPEVYSYIPATRSFFLTIHQAIFGTAGRRDDIQLRFSQDFNYGFEGRIPRAGLNHPLTQWINSESEHILQGRVIAAGSDFHFKSKDGRTLMLPMLSSGTQELLPLMTCLQEYVAASASLSKVSNLPEALRRNLFFLEEPESNIFPSSQYDLVRIFARMANEPVLNAHSVITTHSPYVLTAFNGLIEAWRAGNKSGKREKVAALIPQQYWINENDFAAYTIRQGVLVPIFEKETEGKEGSGLIDGDYLDSISDELGSQFEKLLDIEYAD